MFYVMGMTKKFLWFILWGMDHISSKLHLHHQHLSFFTLHYCITLTWNVFRDTHFSFMLDFSYWKGPSHSDTFRLHHAVFIFSVLSFLSLTTLLLFIFFFLPRLKYYAITFLYLTILDSCLLHRVIIEGSITPLAAGGFISSAKC